MSRASEWSGLPHGPSLFGKLPQKRDFVRMHHDYPAALAFDSWLQDELAQLAESGLSYGDAHVRFVFADAPASLVGILAPSRDRAGRAFPVSIFAPVPSSVASNDAASLWLACERFLGDCERVLADSTRITLAELTQRVDSLRGPSAAELEVAPDAGGNEASESSSAARHAHTQSDPTWADPYPEFVAHGADRTTDCFDCPAPDFQRVADFCRGAQRACGRSTALSIFCAVRGTREPGRALLCLRRNPPGLLVSLTQGTVARGRGWVRL